jgi:XTP/dITP diphosphohydrolase
MNKIVFATENPGKLREIKNFASNFGVEVFMPSEVGLMPVTVEETGDTYRENAQLKVEAYLSQPSAADFIICGDDTGIEINALGGEPGIHTRRWKDGVNAMTDDEIIDYAFLQLDGVSDRSATFRTAVAASVFGGPIEFTSGALPGNIAESVPIDAPKEDGVPFRKIFIVDGQPPVLLWKYHSMSLEERGGKFSHREQAFAALFARVKSIE